MYFSRERLAFGPPFVRFWIGIAIIEIDPNGADGIVVEAKLPVQMTSVSSVP